MGGSSYFQLLNPLILVMFAGGFLSIWRFDPTQHSAFRMGIAYALGAAGFTFDFFLRGAVPHVLEPYVSNVLFLASVAMIGAAFHARFERPDPWAAIVVIASATFALVTVFHFMHPSIAMRSVAMNFGTAAMFLVGCLAFRGCDLRIIDKVALVAMALSVVHCVVRPLAILAYGGMQDVALSYSDSVYALALHFASAVTALMIACAMLFAFGSDLVGRLSEIGETDPLTGLLNRRGLQGRVEAMRTALGPEGEISLVVADIDHFKSVNDRFGHAAGDVVLRSFAEVLSGAAGGRGAVARTGGEEFVIVLPAAGPTVARLAAEGARTALEGMTHGTLAGGRVTASFGVSSWTAGRPFDQAVEAADRALYEAKQGGRNRTVVASPDASERTLRRA